MVHAEYTVGSVANIIGAKAIMMNDGPLTTLLTDSRRISNAPEALFFALSNRRDGHQFITDVYKAGVRTFVVSKRPNEVLTDANYLIVPDVLQALQALAAHHRRQFDLRVVGITGSNGKTIVKEWLYQLLMPDQNIVRSPKSYNSQIGVPLSVWNIKPVNDVALFEAGISAIGEMRRLEAVIQPEIGVLTHLGAAHDEGFTDREQKLNEKMLLFKDSKLLVGQYEELLSYKDRNTSTKFFCWSRRYDQADLYVIGEDTKKKDLYLRAIYHQQEIECHIPFTDQASVENAITCWSTLLALGYQPEVISERMERLTPVSMRLELKNGVNDCSIIDDSYNSDIQSLEIALNFLKQQNQHPIKTLILSDIYQSGLDEDELYRRVAAMLTDVGLNKFIGVGEALKRHSDLVLIDNKYFYNDTSELLSDIQRLNFRDETILLKGARSFEFERISRALVQKAHETVMEINLNALVNNLNFYRSKLAPGVKVMAMVKAFSYGSGTFEIANLLQYHKVDYLAVAYIDEGVALRTAGITLPIMVLNPEPNAFDKLVNYNLEPEVYSFHLFDELSQYLQDNDIINYPVHLKIDTGMHRLGFEAGEIAELCKLLVQNASFKVRSVFSHLVSSDSSVHDDFTLTQILKFEQAFKQIQEAIGYEFIKHINNTSGITRWGVAHYDMVRLGIGLYGVDAAVTDPAALQPIASLKTSISQIKNIKAGETVGYNRNGSLAKDGRIATVRIGYADGYLRAFGNGVGSMLVKGKLVRTVGNIAMDMCMLDVTGVDAKEGDEVIVFNDQQGIEELAKQIGTIPYEILTNISQRVKRVYFYE
ncbi:bifunctional UDP-N-acetylmuramoyl-tripeptide:D-alanyl-D-alanine ligase/alanine racemase [Mucilaginibacter myungsuensis]|uniref:Alanine racemase n=1 Tax=Mucilaginibacter myungsuensis TaxID=649104 RepID=A0A929PW36_9SPHI|nr:bifunctional UDP-N-acetylmuramoyl-tripeptide:D-alanyl-D-alanine ligase/alanine racemase [Mucilaginibacter myungsuensis]MBE9660757.1 bifunctional UDP-N-acetylmuramoyl-tripeptide:D-alanyl-D-alanine ligase/alanine racemase [Mucilaginibacter myungsuensis]MDN3600802.1 bifunctional UDP-N-acetylmuramoyl-tripeptide:D-alanyl-D-alanine ligase/alanine racemase [Mucilaginibacter myungsuensis]